MSTYFLSLVKYIHVWVTITADGMKYLECGGKAASVTHMADLQYIRENVKLHNMGKRNHLAMLAMAITPQVLAYSSKMKVSHSSANTKLPNMESKCVWHACIHTSINQN